MTQCVRQRRLSDREKNEFARDKFREVMELGFTAAETYEIMQAAGPAMMMEAVVWVAGLLDGHDGDMDRLVNHLFSVVERLRSEVVHRSEPLVAPVRHAVGPYYYPSKIKVEAKRILSGAEVVLKYIIASRKRLISRQAAGGRRLAG